MTSGGTWRNANSPLRCRLRHRNMGPRRLNDALVESSSPQCRCRSSYSDGNGGAPAMADPVHAGANVRSPRAPVWAGAGTTGSIRAMPTAATGLGSLRQPPALLAAVAVGLGVGAHILGGGVAVDCVPLLLAAALGVISALTAQRLAGQTYHGASIAVLALSVGQFAMHVALNGHLATDSATDSFLGLNCSLVATHTVATALLAVLLLGAHQCTELALHLLFCAARRVSVRITLVLLPSPDQTVMVTTAAPAWERVSRSGQQWCHGIARPRRGPPALAQRG